MANKTLGTLVLLAATIPVLCAQTRQLMVSVTPSAAGARATSSSAIPYVLRVRGLRWAGDRASRLLVYGETPAKQAPVLGVASGMGYEGGPKFAPPGNFVIPLSQEAGRYLAGKRQVKLWIQYEGMSELRVNKVVVDISVTR